MNRFNEVKDRVSEAVSDVTGHPKVGFDPEVCLGCPQRGDGPLKPCNLCGCPTIEGMIMDRTGRPPGDCVRLEEHRQRG